MVKVIIALGMAVLAATTLAWLDSGRAHLPAPAPAPPTAEEASSGCPQGYVRCRACDGGPGICARSYAFCPECPAP